MSRRTTNPFPSVRTEGGLLRDNASLSRNGADLATVVREIRDQWGPSGIRRRPNSGWRRAGGWAPGTARASWRRSWI